MTTPRFSPSAILALFTPEKQWRLRSLQRAFDVTDEDGRRILDRLLAALVKEGFLRLIKGRIYERGEVPYPPSGAAVVPQGPKSERDILIRAQFDDKAWPLPFPQEAMEAARALDQNVTSWPKEVTDGRDWPLVTIDPPDARDFDDAVCALARPDGKPGTRLLVAIADVSRYVTPENAIDRAAYARTTSVYFPGGVEPMLPHELSSGLCSLKPNENRHAVVAFLDFSPRAELQAKSFAEIVMRSHARLTYAEAQAIIKGEAPAPSQAVADSFTRMQALFTAMLVKREERGSLELDIPEAKVVFGADGEVADVIRYETRDANKMIEEFMIAANRAVAEYLSERHEPALFRVHDTPAPEKLEALAKIANLSGVAFSPERATTPGALNRFLASIKGHPAEGLLNIMLLRTMKQAVYAPENIGHFGLGLDAYCHFTSPIRRYPDLVVHRALKHALAAKGKRASKAAQALMQDMAEHCSDMERRAMEIERNAVDICQAELMTHHLGEEFEGQVVGVVGFGLFVRLAKPFVEGLLHIGSLGDDYYHYDEDEQALVGSRSGRRFRLGDTLKVQVIRADVAARHIDFRLVEETERSADGKGPTQAKAPGRAPTRGARPPKSGQAKRQAPARSGAKPRGAAPQGKARGRSRRG